MLEAQSLNTLEGKKNLLAFSGGVDSTALFFLLLKQKINFDIAIVDYHVREQSQKEVKYAKELASLHNLVCYTFDAPKIDSNFEAKAREIRYDFFEDIISSHNYDNLITAHHLGDRFEWMLMQFCKGAGCAEIAGMQKKQHRGFYTLVRPLLHLEKKELLEFLNANNLKYFVDESNLNQDIKRNSFRHSYSAPLLDKYLSGIKKSFEYLDQDRESLIPEIVIKYIGNFTYFKSSKNQRADIFTIDKHLKSESYMASASERELLKTQKTVVLGRRFLVNQEHSFVFMVPYVDKEIKIPKDFKEECRILKIEPKLRAYLYENKEVFTKVKELLTKG